MDNMNLQKRNDTMAKAMRREKTDKIPFMLIADQWIPYYLGIDRGEVHSYEKAADMTAEAVLDLKVDTLLFPYEPVHCTIPPKLNIMGGGSYMVKNDNKVQVPSSVEIFKPEDYPELIKNPAKHLFNMVYPRRFQMLRESPEKQWEAYQRLIPEVVKSVGYNALCEERDAYLLGYLTYVNPVDFIFDFLREFKGIVNDIKRRPELLRDAGLAIAEEMKKLIDTVQPEPDRAIFCPMHIPAFMRPKEFEKVYWPSFKMLAEYIVGKGLNVVYYFEKDYSHLHDYLQDLPKTNIVGIFQEDDFHVLKKKLGKTMVISGGLSTSLMGQGTKEQCIDHVKQVIDEYASDGGFILAPDNPMMYPADGKPENVKAVAEYVYDYKI